MPPATRASKPICKTASPFPDTTWPHISNNDQDVILHLVCNLISPLGDHRRTHMPPSTGKKRKRTRKSSQNGPVPHHDPPPPPEIAKHILIGINSVTRHMETLAARTALPTMPIAAPTTEEPHTSANHDDRTLRPLSMVIIAHPKPSLSIAHAHLPTLLHLSALKPPTTTCQSHPPRLIPLATSTDARLSSALHIPRVGTLAIFADAPGAKALEDFVREKIPPTACPWIDQAMAANWKGVVTQNEGAAKDKSPSQKAAKQVQ